MNILNRTKEVNYWPSISDMFLVFFVIALVVYSARRTEGDMMENELLVQESEYFCKYYAPEQKKKYEPQEEEPTPRPKLAELLYNAYMEYCERQNRDFLMSEDCIGDYKKVIDKIAKMEKVNCAEDDLPYQKLRKINEKHPKYIERNVHVNSLEKKLAELNQEIDKKDGEITDLKRDIGSLKNKIGNKDGEITDLKRDIGSLKNKIDKKDGEITDLKRDIGSLKNKIGNKDGEIKNLKEQNATLLAKNSREQIVTLSEDAVKFLKGKYEIPTSGLSAIKDKVISSIDSTISNPEIKPDAIVVEIIGHTDDAWSVDEYSSYNGLTDGQEHEMLNFDKVNPGLGLQRALSVKDSILELLRERYRCIKHNDCAATILYKDAFSKDTLSITDSLTEPRIRYKGKEMPIYFKCYSAAWLTPISFSNSIENNPTSPEKATRVRANNGEDDRRIEVFIRPVWNK